MKKNVFLVSLIVSLAKMELIAINANGGFIYLLANQNAVNALQNVPNVLVKINAQSAKMDIIIYLL